MLAFPPEARRTVVGCGVLAACLLFVALLALVAVELDWALRDPAPPPPWEELHRQQQREIAALRKRIERLEEDRTR